jgi:hypothetical protein
MQDREIGGNFVYALIRTSGFDISDEITTIEGQRIECRLKPVL